MRHLVKITTAAIVLLIAAVIYFAIPKTTLLPRPADLSGLPPLKVGDWVLRMGTVTDSRLIRQVGGGDYSHIGMVVKISPHIMVIHATTDGHTALNQVELTRLDEFFSPDLAQKFAVVRPFFLDDNTKQLIAKHLLQRRGEDFVLAARNEPHLYCTTLLADEIQRSNPSFAPHWQHINTPVFHGEYLFPRAFANYPQTQFIYRSPQ